MWKSCCCQKACQYPFYQFDPLSHRNMFWAGIISTKIVYGFEALYRQSPTRRRWLTKKIIFTATADDAIWVNLDFTVRINPNNGALTITINQNFRNPDSPVAANLWPSDFSPTVPRVVNPNSMGFFVFGLPDYSDDTSSFTANETHAEATYNNGFDCHWTIDLSDVYDDGTVLSDFQALNKNLVLTTTDFGVNGIGLDGLPIGTTPTETRYIITARYNECPYTNAMNAILYPPLFTIGILTSAMDVATHWPAPVIIKDFADHEPVNFPMTLQGYPDTSHPGTILETFTWFQPVESYGGQTPGNFGATYPVMQSIWMKFQLDMACGDFCEQKITFQGPPVGPAPTLPTPHPVCTTAEKIPWVKPAGWPDDFHLQPFRRDPTATPVYAALNTGNPSHVFEMKPACYFPPYDQDPYHIFCEHFLISADPAQLHQATGIPCDCVVTNPLP